MGSAAPLACRIDVTSGLDGNCQGVSQVGDLTPGRFDIGFSCERFGAGDLALFELLAAVTLRVAAGSGTSFRNA